MARHRRKGGLTPQERDVVKRVRLAMDADPDLTQVRVAEKLGAGRIQVNRWYNAHESPSAMHLIRLPEVLGVSATWLFQGIGPMYGEVPQSSEALNNVRDQLDRLQECVDDLYHAAQLTPQAVARARHVATAQGIVKALSETPDEQTESSSASQDDQRPKKRKQRG